MAGASSEETIDAYLGTVHDLWPESAPPKLTGPGESGRTELVVLPSRRSPRLVVPRANSAGAARAMLRFSSGLTYADTVKRLGVAAALRARVHRVFPDRIAYDDRGRSLTRHLEDVLGEPVDVSLSLGPARANRKPVLQVFDRRGRSIAFAKVGVTGLAKTHVAREAESLEALAQHDLPAELDVPRTLSYGDWDGMLVLVMTALETSPRQRPSRQWSPPTDTMLAFARSFTADGRPLDQGPWWDWVDATPALVSDPATRDALRSALDALRSLAADRELEIGAWHGDWTPWNQSRLGGRLQLWDFERFEQGVPVGIDLAHYGVNAVVRRDGLSVESIRAGIDLAGLTGDPVVAGAYLAAIVCRYLRSAEGELGDLIVDRGRLSLAALTGLVEA